MEDEEAEVLSLLGAAAMAFDRLKIYHPSDRPEFVAAIHQCQNIVMARAAMRLDPKLFNVYSERVLPT